MPFFFILASCDPLQPVVDKNKDKVVPPVVDGVTYLIDSVTYHTNGKVLRGILIDDAKFDGITFKGGTIIYFHENGQVQRGTLVKDATVKSVTYKAYRIKEVSATMYILDAGSDIFFHENGQVDSGRLAKDTTVNSVIYPDGSAISFYDSGTVYDGTPKQATAIDGVTYQANQVIQFHDNGKVYQGYVEAATTFSHHKTKSGVQRSVNAGIRVKFHKDGKYADVNRTPATRNDE